MRFRYKVIMINIAFLSIALGFLGFLMIYKNYIQAISIQTDFAIEENNLIQSTIEYQLLEKLNKPNPQIAETLSEFGAQTDSYILPQASRLYIFYKDYLVYSNDTERTDETMTLTNNPLIPAALLSSLKLGDKNYTICREEQGYYLYTATKNILEENDFYIISRRDITDTYRLLYRQIRYFLLLISFVLCICTVFLYFISTHLTKPLEHLNTVTDTIAQGEYPVVDISSDDEIGILADKFNRMTLAISEHIEELNLMVRQRDQFVADFTHEIKTPMTTIIGYADTLRSKPLTEDRRQLAYQYIYSEGKRLEAMSMKLFDLIYLRENELVKTAIDTTTLVAEIVHSMQPILDRKKIVLQCEIAPATIYGDQELLKTVFINLIDNARKASPEQSVIEFRGFSERDGYLLQVRDYGCGMTEETKQHICEEFYMADKSRTRAEGGAGLGMSLAAMILKKHDAMLDITSEPKKGSTFTIHMPL